MTFFMLLENLAAEIIGDVNDGKAGWDNAIPDDGKAGWDTFNPGKAGW
jgi:hypothetical protein